MRRPLVSITIDTEADHNARWWKRRPFRFDSITSGIPEILVPLFRRHGAHATYLLTTEVLDHAPSVEVLGGLSGAELGTHLHGTEAESELTPEGGPNYVYTCFYGEEVERQKIAALTQQFHDRLGVAPRSFRAGRYAASGTTARTLASLGYSVETSVTPGIVWQNEVHPEQRLDFREAPLFPYRPSAEDLAREGSLPIWEVPITILPAPRGLELAADLARRRRERSPRRPLWLRPSTTPLPGLLWIAAEATRRAWLKRRVPVLNIMFHSMEFVPGASPYATTDADVRRLTRRLDALLHALGAAGARFVPLTAIPELLA